MAATTLARHVAHWRTNWRTSRYTVVPVDALRPALVDFCRTMHAAGVHGPSVRRLVGSTLATMLDDVSIDARTRVVADAQSAVDVIYLLGHHRTAAPWQGAIR